MHLDRVGRYDQFFELGGHSLLIVTLIERLRQQGLSASVRTVFNTPVLADFAAAIDGSSISKAVCYVPANLIQPGCTAITPDLLPLVKLTQAEIDGLIESVPQGIANIQDIYPLAPLQEGILFHHLLESKGDTYLLRTVLSFDNRPRLDCFLNALQLVIDRHDILRTAIHWQGLAQPVQVVQRQAPLPIFELELTNQADKSVYSQLLEHTDPRHLRLDLQQAPLFAAYIAFDPQTDEWLLSLLTHHMVCEHVTLEFIIAEIQLILTDQAASLPAPLPYRNFIAQALSVPTAEHEAYFREQLGDIDAPTAPFDCLDVQGDGSLIHEISLPIQDDLALQIRRCAKQQGVTAAVLFHVAWAQVLAQCTGRDDVVFGTVLLGRLQGSTGADRVLGLFINTLPVRISLGERSVQQLVRETYQRLSDLLDHEQASLVLAQRCSAVDAPIPLFTSLLNYRHTATQESQTTGNNAFSTEHQNTRLEWEGINVHKSEERTNYPITCSVDDFGQGFSLTAQCTNGIDPERMVAYLNTAIRELTDTLDRQPDCAINRLSILPKHEWQQVINDFNATEADFPQHLCIHQLFEQQVEQTPDAIALVYEDQSLSYDQLNRKANRLAHHLIALGIRPDDRVAICVERSLEMVVGLLGILKAGGAYVPLDPSYPEERLAFMLTDCTPVALLIQQALQAESSLFDERLQVPLILLDALDGQADAVNLEHNPDHLALGLTSQHLAYVIYTSGSTGQPKGVMVSHANVGRLFAATDAQFNFNNDDVWTLFHSFAFDFSVWELWGALLYGGRLVVVPYLTSRNPDDFYRLLCQERVTVLNQTPSAFNQLIAAQAQNPLEHSLRTIVFGGEALEFHSLIPWLERNDSERTQLINMYGITEITVHATYRRLTQQDVEAGQASNVGTGLSDLQIYLLDQHLQPTPLGVTGELYIGGAGVARGYLNRPELTAEHFIDSPFKQIVHGQASARLYKTGDLGRWLPDGSIEYLGRNDFQVKIRGFRIELGEIEAQLSRCDGVSVAVVVAREDVPGDKRLVAYLLTDPGQELSTSDLRSQLSASLADYMLPSAFVTLEAFPLTPNGKLDRKALPTPEGIAYASQDYQAPMSDTELALAKVWSEVLMIDRVGINDNFFTIGGDSIRSISVIAKAKIYGLIFSVVDIFKHQTIASLVKAILTSTTITTTNNAVSLRSEDRFKLPSEVEDAYGVTFLQMGMIFHNQYSQEDALYHDVFSSRLRIPKWQEESFRLVLDALTQKHPILRTAFDFHHYSEPLQLIYTTAKIPVTVFDISNYDEELQTKIIAEFVDQEQKSDFALDIPPLLRIFVHVRTGNSIQFTLSFHHAILDGWSVASLQAEILKEYQNVLSTNSNSLKLPQLFSTPKTTEIIEKQALQSQEYREFWNSYLDSYIFSSLPLFENNQPDTSSCSKRRNTLIVTDKVCSQLKELAEALKVPMRTILLCAHLRMLSLLSGNNDVTTGLVSNVRPEELDGEKVLGLFLNTIPFRQRIKHATWAELINETFINELTVIQHRHYPYFKLYIDNNRTPFYEIVFNYVNFHVYDELNFLEGIDLLERTGIEVTGYGLAVTASYNSEGISISLENNPERISMSQVERILGYYESILNSIAEDPHAFFDERDLLSSRERQQLLIDFNATETNFPQEVCIHQLFEQQVEQTPDAIALVFENQSLTYEQLNRQANRLAHRLIALGIRPDDRVAVCVERSLESVIGLLGILKSGGAYVPLDPSYPEGRLAYMLVDCSPVAVLTQQTLQTQLLQLNMPLQAPMVLVEAANAEDQALESDRNPDSAALGLTSSHLAYVIYTSGSTGLPKGVMNPHSGLCNLTLAQKNLFSINKESHILQFASLSFDASIWEIVTALCNGACLCLANKDDLLPGQELTNTLLNHKITHVLLPSSVVALFPKSLSIPELTLIVGGDICPPDLAIHWSKQLRLYNAYGPTETAVFVTTYRCHPNIQNTVPIGYPIANTQIYILDNYLQPVPLGTTGELYIGGAGVARGYLNRPELTAERFIDNPFKQNIHGQASARLYKTGDLGRWLPDGSIEYLGRNDFQVKIRGFRIELGEIETQLSRCAGVREAVVLAREDVPGDKRLVAYLLADAGHTLSAADLRSQLSASLADYMLPSAFVTLDAFPLTPNGKLDRKALPAPDGSAVIYASLRSPTKRNRNHHRRDLERAVASRPGRTLRPVLRAGRPFFTDCHFDRTFTSAGLVCLSAYRF